MPVQSFSYESHKENGNVFPSPISSPIKARESHKENGNKYILECPPRVDTLNLIRRTATLFSPALDPIPTFRRESHKENGNGLLQLSMIRCLLESHKENGN